MKFSFAVVALAVRNRVFVLIFFTSDKTYFCSLFKVRRHVLECMNNEIVVGLCSEPLMRLSYYIHLGYCKKLSYHMGIEPRSADCEVSIQPLDQSANFKCPTLVI